MLIKKILKLKNNPKLFFKDMIWKKLFLSSYLLEKHISNRLDIMEYNIKKHNENLILVSKMHDIVFSKYKNIYNDKEIVIFGSGPSLNLYNEAKNDRIYIGCNRVFKTMDLDYLFIIDAVGTKDYLNEIKFLNCKKFIGRYLDDINYSDENYWVNKIMISEDFFDENTERYYTSTLSSMASIINYDISVFPLTSFSSVIHDAFSFALWTGAKKIYLVGCDCALNGYYDGSKQNLEWTKNAYDRILDGWKKYKVFCDVYYPEVQIISVCPVGLK
ncbi:DUF115 domain-containing protein, partial [Campylobacter jejuni]|nr:DUF115 domain-containing protein [Campylobacter jejuni]